MNMEGPSQFEKNDKFLSKLTKEQQETERDKMQELVNMMRVKIGVDQNGAIKDKIIDGKPVYPTKEQYEKALNEIEELERKVKDKNINEKLISNLHKIILIGGKKIIDFLSIDFKKQKKGIEETIEEMIKGDSSLQLEALKEMGDQYGRREDELEEIKKAERIEELEYKGYD